MLIKCNFCEASVDDLEALIFHLKHIHSQLSVYECNLNNCNRVFSVFRGYLRHVEKHLNFDSSDNFDKSLSEIKDSESNSLNQINLFSFHENGNNNNIDNNNDNNIKKIADKVLTLALKLFSHEKVPRSFAEECLKDVRDILSLVFKDSTNYLDVNLQILESQTKFISFIQQMGIFIKPKTYLLHQQLENTKKGNKDSLKKITYDMKIIPLQEHFSYLFNNTCYLKKVLNFIEKSKLDPHCFLNSQFWKKNLSQKPQDTNVLYLPNIVFADEFEPNNPLGSHRGISKICGVYTELFCLPEDVMSKMAHINLLLLFFAQDRKLFHNNAIFFPVFEELNKLRREGIVLSKPINNITNVKILTCLVCGDNEGLNSFLGLSSFSSKFYCRMCRMEKKDCQVQCKEDKDLLRDCDNYNEDCSNKSHGIVEPCVFNKLLDFNFIESPSIDPMHDILEGVVRFVMIELLDQLIKNEPDFSIPILNKQILEFDFPFPHSKNKPPLINNDWKKSENISMQANEWLVFVMYFGFLVGNFVNKKTQYWKMYLLLRETIDITYANNIQDNIFDHFSKVIEELLQIYLQLDPNNKLKPKMHHLTHYPSIFKSKGKLKFFACNRFEQFHQPLKRACNSGNNRINLLETASKKCQLRQANILINFEKHLAPTIQSGTPRVCIEPESNKFKLKYNFQCKGNFSIVKYYQLNSFKYEKDSIICVSFDISGAPIFGQIEKVILYREKYFFGMKLLKTISFNNCYYAYEVETTKQYFTFPFLNLDSMQVSKMSILIEKSSSKTLHLINWSL